MNDRPQHPFWAQHDLLARSPLFAELTPAELDALVAASRIAEVPPYQFLFRTGEPIREAWFLIHGTVKRSATLPGAATTVIELAQTQQLLALGEIFGVSRYISSAETIMPCVLVVLDMRKLRALVRSSAGLASRLLEAIARRQCATESDITGAHYSVTSVQRLLDYLIELSGRRPALAGETTVVLKASKKVIASRMGMTAETLSRSLRHLIDSGLIVVDGRNVHIQNAALVDGIEEGSGRVSFPRKQRASVRKLTTGALVNLCGRPRMLSQRLAIAWAMIARDISPTATRVKLRQLEADLSRHLARLEKAGLHAELGGHLTALTELWARYRRLLFEFAPAGERAAQVLALSEDMLQAADRLAHAAARVADIPEARHVNVAGRNRMLSQRIVKLFLFREWLGDEKIGRDIEASSGEFRRNLTELRRGGKHRPEIAAQLDEVATHWEKLANALATDTAHAGREHRAQVILAVGERLLRHVDTTVKLYERLAPQPA